MWKKDEDTSAEQEPAKERPRTGSSRSETDPRKAATIGPSITINGDVKGDEDLVIQGRIEGSVDLENQRVTVGREGRVKAAIVGRVVTVEGEVEGDLTADEQVILRSEAHVEGDITAPRVVLEDGANFRGLVDMSNPSREEKRAGGKASDARSGASRDSASTRKSKSGSRTSSESGSKSEGSSEASPDRSGTKAEKASS